MSGFERGPEENGEQALTPEVQAALDDLSQAMQDCVQRAREKRARLIAAQSDAAAQKDGADERRPDARKES